MTISLTGGKKPAGFTLMEMLIVIALFALTATIMAQTYVTFNALQRKTANRAVLVQEMRNALEQITRAVRNNPIDDASAISPKSTTLRLVQPDGTFLVFAITPFAPPGCAVCKKTPTFAESFDNGATWHALTASRVQIDRFDVYVRPTVSPFELVNGAYPSDVQPYVTIHLKMTYSADNPKDNSTIETQTTIASRLYER